MSKPLDRDARDLLKDLCECEDGRGLVVSKEMKRAVSSLVRHGLAWTLASIFTVVIVTDAGKAHFAELSRTP